MTTNKTGWMIGCMACAVCLSFVALGQDATPATDGASLEPIEINIPEECLGGTPVDYWSPNLEPEDYRDRPPFMAPKGTTNVAKGKPVTSKEPPVTGTLKQLTDGDKHWAKSSRIELPEGLQWVQIDLETECDIYAILLWHYHEGKRVYFDIVVQASNDKEFKSGVTTVYNNDHDNSAGLGVGKDNEYVEKYTGRLMDAKGASGRYVRFYSRCNTADDFNHYVEAEVYGIAKAS